MLVVEMYSLNNKQHKHLVYCFFFNFAISFQKLRNKGHNDCASPDPDDCFGHSPVMDDHFGKLNEESDLMYKRCGVSTSFVPCCFVLIPVFMLMFTTGAKQERTQRL